MNNLALNQNQSNYANYRSLKLGQNFYGAKDATNYWLLQPQAYSQSSIQSAQPVKVVMAKQQQDELDGATSAIGVAGLLRLAQWGIEKLSGVCASALMAGKEFASEKDVKKVANAMKKDNDLVADIHYIDNGNKGALKNRFPQLAKSLDTVANGGNAFYTSQGSFAVAPKSKPSLILHELGHATNFEKSKFFKGLQKCRVVGMYAPMALAFLNDVSGHRKDGKKNFIERNAGLIGFSAFLPTIIEEGAASWRGIQVAKKTLGAGAKLGVLKKNYFLAWMTYVLAGVGVGIASKLAITKE